MLGGKKRNGCDPNQMDLPLSLSLPVRHDKEEEENESSGMMIKKKSEISATVPACDLFAGRSQKN